MGKVRNYWPTKVNYWPTRIKRTIMLNVRVSKEEMNLLRKLAKRRKLRISDIIRHLIRANA